MKLSNEDKWMLSYLHKNLEQWDDVKDGANRAIKRIESHDDFMAWADYFLPKARKVALKKALLAYKLQNSSSLSTVRHTEKVSVSLHEKAAQLLREKAEKEHCSMSEVLVKHLA